MRESEPRSRMSTRLAKAAQIHDKIISFRKGYSSRVGERGTPLSGGELQRLAIARAFVRHPNIVIFDKATSSISHGIDSVTEASVQLGINNTKKKRQDCIYRGSSALYSCRRRYDSPSREWCDK